MKSATHLLQSITLVFLFISAAQADVYSTRRDELYFIKTTRQADQVGFEQCSMTNTNRCVQIGKQPFYPIDSLRRARTHLRNCAIGVGTADVAAGAAVAAATFYTGVLIFIGDSTAAISGSTVSAVAGSAGAGTVVVEQLLQVTPTKAIRLMKTLDDDIITDRTYHTDISISDFAARLNETLRDHVK